MSARASWVRGGWSLSRAGAQALSLLALVISDLSALAIALGVAVGVRMSILPALSRAFDRPTYPLTHYAGLWWIPAAYLGALLYAGLYTRRDPYWEEVRRCLLAATMGTILVFAVLAVAKIGEEVSRPVVVLTWACLLVVLPLVRGVVKEALFAAGPWRRRALLVGEGAIGEALLEAFCRQRTLGYDVVEVISNPLTAPERAAAVGARDVILATPQMKRTEFLSLVERLREVAENVLLVPDLAEAPVLGVEVLGLLEDRALLLRVPNNLLRPWNLVVKRAFDVVVGTLLGLLLLPLIAVMAVAIVLDSSGSAFHIEPRIGRRRIAFACYKLRTMFRDGDRRLEAFMATHPEAAAEWERYRKLRSYDPRVTRVGKVLRRYSFDEMPQLLNVVRGEMSLVGPRPYLPDELSAIAHDRMCGVLPGMTGLWQVSGKNALDLRERARLDRWYVNNWSLWLDVIILVKTLPAILRTR
jgi:Undecaprenyl-phosphate galactose phosphotransferase WbaP